MKRGSVGGRDLERYNAMRDFGLTDEPNGRVGKTETGRSFVVQKHDARRLHYDFRLVSEQIAVLMTRAAPDRYVATMTKRARVGKIFIDYLRNAEGATAVLPYSPRARPGLTVALPVAWKDLRAVDPQELTIVTVPMLLARRRTDPWADLLDTRQTLPRELLRAAAGGLTRRAIKRSRA